MADIHSSFTKSEKGWLSTAQEVDGKFNIHLEATGTLVGDVTVYLKTTGNKYYKADVIKYKIDDINGGLCAEGDFSVLGAKSALILSSIEPTYAEVTATED